MSSAETKAWMELLDKLEIWMDELASRGPSGLPEVYREMAQTVDPEKRLNPGGDES